MWYNSLQPMPLQCIVQQLRSTTLISQSFNLLSRCMAFTGHCHGAVFCFDCFDFTSHLFVIAFIIVHAFFVSQTCTVCLQWAKLSLIRDSGG